MFGSTIRIIRKARWLVRHGPHMQEIADECHRLFALACVEKNREQFEALHADHTAKAAEYEVLMEELRNL